MHLTRPSPSPSPPPTHTPRDIHNIFGYYYHLATNEGLIARGHQVAGEHGDRPFVLSRAFFSGVCGCVQGGGG